MKIPRTILIAITSGVLLESGTLGILANPIHAQCDSVTNAELAEIWQSMSEVMMPQIPAIDPAGQWRMPVDSTRYTRGIIGRIRVRDIGVQTIVDSLLSVGVSPQSTIILRWLCGTVSVYKPSTETGWVRVVYAAQQRNDAIRKANLLKNYLFEDAKWNPQIVRDLQIINAATTERIDLLDLVRWLEMGIGRWTPNKSNPIRCTLVL